MKTKRKISVRKILQLLLTITVAAGCIIAMVSASSIEGEKPLKALPVVHIKNDRKYQFIEQKKIMDLAIYNRDIDILNTPVSKLGLRGIEKAIKADPWVADAQVFVDIDRVMHIYVTQRVPVARIFRNDGTSYYMDSTLHTMPLSESYTYYTVVVTNAPEMKEDSVGLGLRKQIAIIVGAINTDSFWSAQVSQVVVDSSGMFELMPVLGNQRILFGDTSRMEEKFSNLVAFYRNVLNRIGWDKYETLDVRFRGQVVAAPSLPYKGPVDKAISKMNWITSIEVTEAQRSHEDSIRAVEERLASMAATKAKADARARDRAASAGGKGSSRKTDRKVAHSHTVKHTEKANARKKAVAKSATKNSAKQDVKARSPHSASNLVGTKKPDAKSAAHAEKGKAPKREVKTATKTPTGKQGEKSAGVAHPAARTAAKKMPGAAMKSQHKGGVKKATVKDAAGKGEKKNETMKTNNTGKAKYVYPAENGH